MSTKSFENFGKLAHELSDHTIIAGRSKLQKDAEKNILNDIIKKIDLRSTDSLLEIGCGAGNLLIPLSFITNSVAGVDHHHCIDKLLSRFPQGDNVSLISGDFLNVKIDENYDKILCYSVLHYLSDRENVFNFIDKALLHLSPGGRALFGDVPNYSTKQRFLSSSYGKEFDKKWRESIKTNGQNEAAIPTLAEDDQMVCFDDSLVLDILMRYREMGFHAYLLSQPSYLSFGCTREDILIVKVK